MAKRASDTCARPSETPRRRRWMGAACFVVMAGVGPVAVGEVLVGVAANFADTARALTAAFEERSEQGLRLLFGSTGKLYAQVRHGLPIDVLLAADAWRPRRLEAEGRAVAGSRCTYARGRLVLWSPDPRRIRGPRTLAEGRYRRLAMANPNLAPYGAAARQTLVALKLYQRVRARIVTGENVAQALSLAASGNAELGFVAAAQLRALPDAGSRWVVPEDYHEALVQQGVLLARAADSRAARAFLGFVCGPAARPVIRAYGYEVD